MTSEDDGDISEDRAFEPAAVAELTKPVVEMVSAPAKKLLDKLKLGKAKSADDLFTQFKVEQAGENFSAANNLKSGPLPWRKPAKEPRSG